MKKTVSFLLAIVMLLSAFSGISLTAYADECEHLNTSIQNQKDATTTEKGYTGDTVCDDCGEVIEQGEDIPMLPSGWVTEDGKTYYYDENGTMLKYFKQIEGVYYYFNGAGVMQRGWIKFSGGYRYFDGEGKMLTGVQKIGANTYRLDENGYMLTGWQTVDGNKYYYNSNGVMQTRWQKIGGCWYWFHSSGKMLTGWQRIGGKWYWFHKGNGKMLTGWLRIGGKWYYCNSSGARQTGWIKLGSYWYYLNSSGVMLTGWQKIGGAWYYMNSSGRMVTGWQKINNKWYYFASSGVMQSGYVNVYATYSSKYSSNANRTNNLKVASAAINGTILKPGDTFDFNKVVGWRTAARGYLPAPVFVGKDGHADGYGGGVCQVSSTLFNAALLANMGIIERHQHSQKVYYVPFGRDAAISGSEKNMRFKNTTPYTIKIEMAVSGGVITATLYTVEHVSPPTVSVTVSRSGSTYTMRRYVNGTCNYTTRSTY